MNENLETFPGQAMLINLAFIVLGFFFRIYLERKKSLQTHSLYSKKVTPEDWSRIFTESGIAQDSMDKWHALLKEEHPAIYKGLSKTIDI